MQDPFQITFKGMPATPEVETEVRAWLEKLAPLRAGARMTSGQIAIEAVFEHQRHRQGYRYQVQMRLATDGNPMTVGVDDLANVPHEDVYVAVRNGFRSIRRQLLEDQAQRIARGEMLPAVLAPVDSVGLSTSVGGSEPVNVATSVGLSAPVDVSTPAPLGGGETL